MPNMTRGSINTDAFELLALNVRQYHEYASSALDTSAAPEWIIHNENGVSQFKKLRVLSDVDKYEGIS
ncbi:hypothetical protein E2C01_034461 [Portunus trituberculatus]|uniref:Uncharacterized protein n=1 Tax=Portunus trituberculatus TaxID=210409 RepID=A0A5B7F5V3_PORTR|nr:hypothetical protein [Portunus trituberculatus]